MKETPKSGPSGQSKPEASGILSDPRFAHLVSDPRFKNIHKSTKSVKIDQRFKSMFKDDQFKVKYTTDRYGRRINKSSTEDLEKYYELSSDDDEEEEKRKEEAEIVKDEATGDNDDLHSDTEIADELKEKLKDLNVDYARGQGALLSDSSSDDESSGEEDTELFIEHVWGELDNDAQHTEESTKRLAVCNMDWDRLRASDIMVLCNSFMPPGGSIVSVTIYPSEYGKERMAEEEVKGPQELTESGAGRNVDSDEDYSSDSEVNSEVNSDNEEGDNYHMEKLRQYQLNRLKYFYAVIECNTVAAADKLYHECDGIEYESTATKMDLRFIPDDMTFDDEPKDQCTELPNMSKYQPRLFTTTALQQAKVELTWDENDIERKELTEKVSSGKLDGISDVDLRKYVAYSSEDDDEEDIVGNNIKGGKQQKVKTAKPSTGHPDDEPDDEDSEDLDEPQKNDMISVYKDLLKDINDKEAEKKKNRIEMEFSWGVGSKKDTLEPSEKNETRTAEAELTPFEKILEKKRAKKKARKGEIKKLKKAQQKGSDASSGDDESADDLPDGIDLNDPYFAEEFATSEFGPAKKTDKQKKNKQNKKKAKSNESDDESDEKHKETELALLLNDDDDHRAHFSLKKIQENENESKSRKRKKQLKAKKSGGVAPKAETDDFQINVDDKRFSAIYSSHLFNIDPTDSHFKKTKAMETLIHEKLNRKSSGFIETDVTDETPQAKKPKKDVALNMLVKNLKRKVQQQK